MDGASVLTPGGPTVTRPDVFLVAENGNAGGIGRYCIDLAGLVADQARVLCLCPTPCPGGAGACWLADQCLERGVPLDRVQMPGKAWRRGLVGTLQQWRRFGRPLLHVNGRRGNAIALVARLIAPGFRYVTSVHGVLGLHARRNAVYRLVDLAAGRAAKAVIAVSRDTHARLLRAGSPRSRTYTVQNALAERELRAFGAVAERRRGQPRASAGLRIGFLGRLSPEKGTQELIAIADALYRRGAPVTLTIAGDGPDRDWMVDRSASLVEQGFVTFRGVLQDSAAFLAEVDVLVMPSHNEGLPYALLEAMAAGCAVVAFAVGGIPEVVCDATVGVLVPPGDTERFVAELLRLSEDPASVSALGSAAAQRVRDHFALDARLPILLKIQGIDRRPAQTEPTSGQ
jgi:glycosyltransferase involved in cell wall biosynthesis